MERLLLALFLASSAQCCPPHCTCHNLSESLSTLCANKGLLFVPLNIDRRTVELRLAGNFIREVESRDFANMSGLVDLTLSRNTLASIQPMAFGHLGSLRSLHLDGNRLTELRADSLRGLASLQRLTASGNQLARLSAAAFDDFLLTLEDLDLSFNNLARVPWQAVSRMLSLHALSLEHNLIERLEAGVLSGLASLDRLDLTSNRLQTLPPDPLFARLPPGTTVNFGGNPLHCNCELLWLRRLARADDLETCGSPAQLAGRYFWHLSEGELVCEPPLITRHTRHLWVLEGQRATLRCRAVGDPPPLLRWVSPGDRVVANSSGITSYGNGTLDIVAAAANDSGTYTCFAANPAGESRARARLRVVPLARRDGGTGRAPQPGSSDISGPPADEAEHVAGITVAQITSTTARVGWSGAQAPTAVWMYQIQYNSSSDHTLVYRIVPSTSKGFDLKNLAPGAVHDLCVLAIHSHDLNKMAATRVLGCARFGTQQQGPACDPLVVGLPGATTTVTAGSTAAGALLVLAMAGLAWRKGRRWGRTVTAKVGDMSLRTPSLPAPSACHRLSPQGGGDIRAERSHSLDMGVAQSRHSYRAGVQRSQSVHGTLLQTATDKETLPYISRELEESIV
ncbi:leucine-rich repeat and fibronectin type-III domain-containing protein 4-like isoform X2 [Narcine bancroftii]